MKKKVAKALKTARSTCLKKGDTVMVIAGGNKETRPTKGQVGKIVRFVGDQKQRVVVEGVNMITRHRKASGPDKPAGKIQLEGSIHISNLMYYAEKLKKPVRLKYSNLEDGRKVRGYLDNKNKSFVQVD